MEIARKMTVGGINNVRKGFKGVTETKLVARILGIADTAVQEDGALGSYWKFTGEFQGTNEQGEMHAAPVLMLPKPADDMLAAAVKQAAGGSVKFGFDIYVEPREDVAIGYAYKIKPLLEVKPSNPLADLIASIPALPGKAQESLALDAPPAPAPAPAEAPAPAPAPAASKKK